MIRKTSTTKRMVRGDSWGQLPPPSRKSPSRGCVRGLSENGPQLSPTVPADELPERLTQHSLSLDDSEGRFWDVRSMTYPFGVGKPIGRVRAKTRKDAESAARAQYGAEVWVELYNQRPTKTRRNP